MIETVKPKVLADGRHAFYSDIYNSHGVKPLGLVEAALLWLKTPRHFGMANFYSDDFTKVRAGRRVAPNVFGGRARILAWDFASLAASATADIFVLGKLYKGDKVVMGREFHSALSGGAGTSNGSFGTYTVANDGVTPLAVDDVDRYLAATSLEAAGQNDIASLQGSTQGVGVGPLHEAASDLLVACTNSSEQFATAGRLSGWLLIVRD